VIPNAVMIGNQKGGVGKTTLVANLGGICAEAGWRVLVIDVDPQGNLARHLGVMSTSDKGRNLFDAVTEGTPLVPMREVRSNLDFVAGGAAWKYAMSDLGTLGAKGLGLEHAVAPLAGDYDLVLIDTPPTTGPVHEAAGLMAHFILVTTAIDDASLDGLLETFRSALELRNLPRGNPWLEVLGVIVFSVPTQATAWRQRIQRELAQSLGDGIPVFKASLRDIPTTAAALQRRGLLITEAEAAAKDQVDQLFARLREQLDQPADEVRLTEKSIANLRADYFNLAEEFQTRFRERLAAYAEQVAS
jgi:chromosome partitioning protein